MTQMPARRQPGREAAPPISAVAPDAYVLANRALRPSTNLRDTSRFADDTWDLRPAVHEAHERGFTINWNRFDPTFRTTFKEYVYVLLTEQNPPGLTRGSVQRIAPKTICSDITGLVAFANWLVAHQVARLDQLNERDLDRWLDHVRALPPDTSARARRTLLLSVQRLAAHRLLLRECDRLPSALLWDGESVEALLDTPKRDRSGNLTPRINEETMNALLHWCLLLVEQAGPQVVTLLQDQRANPAAHQQVRARVTGPRWQTRMTDRQAADQLAAYLNELERNERALPGKADGTVHWAEVSIAAGLRPATLYKSPHLREAVQHANLPVARPTNGSIHLTGPDGPVTVDLMKRFDLVTWNRLLHAACFVVIAYLSGMRPGEVLNLKRGCIERDERLGIVKLWGKAWKGVTTAGAKVAEGQDRPVPWVVTETVANVVALLEELTPFDYLFPPTFNNNSARAPETHSRTDNAINDDIRDLIDWVNQTFHSSTGQAIPADDHVMQAARFRRTLAWFIVRRPRGLVAAAVQYGHLFTNITMGYAGHADAGWLDDLALERLFAAVDQALDDERLLEEGEQVSGAAATEYARRVRGAARAFEGRTITAVRQAQSLLEREDLQVFHGDGMTCVFNLLTAACLTDRQDQPTTPDLPGCVASCRNRAHTDRDIAAKRDEHERNRQDIDDPLTPEPLRERLRARNEHLSHAIAAHAASVQEEVGP